MKWKEIIIGAIVTLLITIIGGFTVWKFTKEPPKPTPKAEIIYEVDTPAKFSSESKSLIFNTIRIGNLGNQTAHKLVLSIEFPSETEILDFSMSHSSGASARENQRVIESNKYERIIGVDSLMPGETVTVSIITNDYSEKLLRVSARHKEGIAETGTLTKKQYLAHTNETAGQAKEAALSALILGLLLSTMIFRLKKSLSSKGSINNSAFVLLHRGLIEEAEKMLENEINTRGGSSYELANLGLCKALRGDTILAEKYLSAAELYNPTKQIIALVAFNRAISEFVAGNKENSKKQFIIAASATKSRVKEYVRYSEYAQLIVTEFEELSEYLPDRT